MVQGLISRTGGESQDLDGWLNVGLHLAYRTGNGQAGISRGEGDPSNSGSGEEIVF